MRHRLPFGSAFLEYNELEKFLLHEPPGVTVIKTHKVGLEAFDRIHSGKAKAVCTFRDPRDCAVSLRTFVGEKLEEVTKGILIGLELIKLYEMSPHTLFVRYEEMIVNPLEQIRRIAAHLNIELTEEQFRQIDHQTNLQASRRICQELKHRPEAKIFRADTHRVDPATNLHDNHIFSGDPGRWRLELTSEQARSLTRLFRPWLLSLGYETPESLAALEDIWRSVSTGLPEQLPSITPDVPMPTQTPPPGALAPEM
jgi:hypothetical protein